MKIKVNVNNNDGIVTVRRNSANQNMSKVFVDSFIFGRECAKKMFGDRV